MEHVTEDMVFRRLLEPLVDAGVLFQNPSTGRKFNPLSERDEFSRKFLRVLTNLGVEGAINGDEEDVSNFRRYLGRHMFENFRQPRNVNIDRIINNGLESIRTDLEEVKRERERGVIGAVAKSRGLPGDLEYYMKQFAGTRKPRRKAGRKTRKAKRKI